VDHTDCSGYCDLVKWVTVQSCFPDIVIGEVCCITDFAFAPNPTSSESYLYFTVTESANINIQLINNAVPTSSSTIQNNTTVSEGNYMYLIETSNLPNGIYVIQIQINNNSSISTNIVVQH
jgi:hypothetical protein